MVRRELVFNYYIMPKKFVESKKKSTIKGKKHSVNKNPNFHFTSFEDITLFVD